MERDRWTVKKRQWTARHCSNRLCWDVTVCKDIYSTDIVIYPYFLGYVYRFSHIYRKQLRICQNLTALLTGRIMIIIIIIVSFKIIEGSADHSDDYSRPVRSRVSGCFYERIILSNRTELDEINLNCVITRLKTWEEY